MLRYRRQNRFRRLIPNSAKKLVRKNSKGPRSTITTTVRERFTMTMAHQTGFTRMDQSITQTALEKHFIGPFRQILDSTIIRTAHACRSGDRTAKSMPLDGLDQLTTKA